MLVSFYTPPFVFSTSLGQIALFAPKNLNNFISCNKQDSLLLGKSNTAQYLSGVYFLHQLKQGSNLPTSNMQESILKPKCAKIDLDKCEESTGSKELDIFKMTKQWLDMYFSGEILLNMPPVILKGSNFRIRVWRELLKIPYGKTSTYLTIAQKIAKDMHIAKMSAQAVGGAISNNPISIIIPCHRVIGSNGSLIGYAGGLNKKKILLDFEAKQCQNNIGKIRKIDSTLDYISHIAIMSKFTKIY